MSPDDDDAILDAARAGFREEAQEMLAQFEAALLVMESAPEDRENLNAAFRAAHTLKGSAGLFGYQAVVAFTHEAETLLEALRAGARAVDDRATALLLESRDQMAALLAEVDSGDADPALAARSTALAAQLRALRSGDAAACAGTAALPAAEPTAVAEAPAPADDRWQISLRWGADALRNGLDPLAFIRYLDRVGQVQHAHTLHEQVPPLEALDAESCCLGFELCLRSRAGRQVLSDVFSFCVDDCDILILGPDDSPADWQAGLERRATDAAGQAALLALWQRQGVVLPLRQASPAAAAAPPIERRAEPSGGSRRSGEAERRQGVAERRGGDETRFIRVRADKLDRLIDLIGELVIASSGAQLVAQAERSPRFAEATQRIHDLVQEARDGALGLRMVPIGETFARFNRVVRDVCRQLDKDVLLHISGGDTELDKSMVETLADPLMHLVRNSLDHGIETAAERLAAGKPAQGQLRLHAHHESGAIVIEVADDGRGLNRERILAKAVAQEVVAADAVLDDPAVYALIFAAGISTAEAVTNLSGRGVGMDVVRRNIESLRGQVRIASSPGQGTTMQIRLPLTLAIIDGFLTRVGGVGYVLPLELVAECLEVPPECEAEGARVTGHFDLRGEVLPFLDVGLFYRHPRPPPGTRRSLVLVRDGPQRVGLVVDRLYGEHQTVIKPLGRVFQHIRGLAGSTILGSGEVALILDVPAMLDLAIRQQRRAVSPVTPCAESTT